MRILVLSSIVPSRRHSTAGQIVLGTLLDSLCRSGHETFSMIDLEASSASTVSELVEDFPNVTFEVVESEGTPNGVRRAAKSLQGLMNSSPKFFRRGIRDLNDACSRIREVNPDLIIFFWDTRFEQVIIRISGDYPLAMYGARPPYMGQVARNETMPGHLRRAYHRKALYADEARHIKRMRLLTFMSNISKIDSDYYNEHGISCHYIPNTWSDPGPRIAGLSNDSAQTLIASVGRLQATGNTIGLRYLAREVLPALPNDSAPPWRLVICGQGPPPSDIDRELQSSEWVDVKGFVQDFEAEIRQSTGFVVLNSTGNYQGSYTRVVLAMAYGKVVVTTPELITAMPELAPDENCLVGSSGRELVRQIDRLVDDADLRHRLEKASRLTFEQRFNPDVVFGHFLKMIEVHSANYCGGSLHGGE